MISSGNVDIVSRHVAAGFRVLTQHWQLKFQKFFQTFVGLLSGSNVSVTQKARDYLN